MVCLLASIVVYSQLKPKISHFHVITYLCRHISGRVSNNRKGTAGSNTEDPDYVVESEAATLRAMSDQLQPV